MTYFRVGNGYDVHRFAKDRKLIIGGEEIDFELGLLGHSDADVLLHAICDALLGAAGLGDIGKHFPDTNDEYKNIDSRILLRNVAELIKNEGYKVSNVDCIIVAQKPKLAPHIQNMVRNIASDLSIDENRVNVKATTEEGLGFTGEMKGILAHAVALIVK